jgi:hypothetical protein
MARSLDLPEEIKGKLDNPRAKVFTTLERIFDSSVGREYLKVVPDSDHGLRGTTAKAGFLRAFRRLVEDVALGKQSSRTLNTNEDIKHYFDSWNAKELPTEKGGSFVPADIIKGQSVASPARPSPDKYPAPSYQETSRFASATSASLTSGVNWSN